MGTLIPYGLFELDLEARRSWKGRDCSFRMRVYRTFPPVAPIIVIAQLNRQPELRGNGKPRLSDLRESGSIEQDADVVGLLVRAEYYETDEEAKQEVAGEAELIIAKQRNGPIGDVPLVFLREFTRFERVFEKLTLPLAKQGSSARLREP